MQQCQFQGGGGGGGGLVSWSDDNTVKVWDLAAETNTATISHHADYVR